MINGGVNVYNYNLKLGFFIYKDRTYRTGTKFVYNGTCYLNNEEVYFNNEIVTFVRIDNDVRMLKDNIEYTCSYYDFENKIVRIITEPPKEIQANDNKKEFYWTDDKVVKTLWYVVIMVVSIIFKDFILIWIFATLIWYGSVFKK